MAIKRQDISNGGINYYRTSQCPAPECGKTFEHTTEWAYKRGYESARNLHYFCSWSCMRAWDENKPPKKLKGA